MKNATVQDNVAGISIYSERLRAMRFNGYKSVRLVPVSISSTVGEYQGGRVVSKLTS